MRKSMTSTALAAAGALALASGAMAQDEATKPTLSLGGYLNEIVGVVLSEDDDPGRASVDIHNDGEIFFNGSGVLGNGMRVSARAELEISQDSGKNTLDGKREQDSDTIDEVYVRLSGAFGELRLGQDDSVAWLMVAGYSGSWATQVGQNLSFDAFEWASKGNTTGSPSHVSVGGVISGDPEKISYFSPRFNGFQVGFSYTPNAVEHDDGVFARDDELHDGVGVAANYSGNFGDSGIGLAVGYETAKVASTAPANADNPERLNVAMRVDYGPIRVAGSWSDIKDNRTIIDVGARYSLGPSAVSLTYANANADGSKAFTQAGMMSYAYNLGPGVKWHLNLIHTSVEGTGGEKNKALAATTGINLSF